MILTSESNIKHVLFLIFLKTDTSFNLYIKNIFKRKTKWSLKHAAFCWAPSIDSISVTIVLAGSFSDDWVDCFGAGGLTQPPPELLWCRHNRNLRRGAGANTGEGGGEGCWGGRAGSGHKQLRRGQRTRAACSLNLVSWWKRILTLDGTDDL